MKVRVRYYKTNIAFTEGVFDLSDSVSDVLRKLGYTGQPRHKLPCLARGHVLFVNGRITAPKDYDRPLSDFVHAKFIPENSYIAIGKQLNITGEGYCEVCSSRPICHMAYNPDVPLDTVPAYWEARSNLDRRLREEAGLS